MLKRRKFIKGMTALGIVTVVAPLSSCGDGAEEEAQPLEETQAQTVYRLQSRKIRSCNACQKHHRYKVFLDQTAADQNRAHLGCKCGIVTQQVAVSYFDEIQPFELNGVIDLRTVFGYVPA